VAGANDEPDARLQPAPEARTPPAAPAARWSGEGELYGFASSRIDYVGVFRFRALVPSAAGEWDLRWENTVPVLSTSGRGKLIVDDIDYQAEAGFARRAAATVWTPFLRYRGSAKVDRPGSAQVVVAGLRVGDLDPLRRLGWEVEAGAALADAGLEARACGAVRGEWRFSPGGRWQSGLQAAWDAIWLREPEAVRADVSAGPFLRLARPGGVQVTARAVYLHARHPLGLEDTGVLIGVQFMESAEASRRDSDARIDAALAAGGGNDRSRAQQTLEFLSSSFPLAGRRWHLRLLADNVLLDARFNDLYYALEGGIETASGPLRAGVQWYHRSGHALGGTNDRRLSLNIVEVQARSPRWHPDLPQWPGGEEGWRRLDWQASVGRVMWSEFGEHQRWSARGGARWILSGSSRRLAPYVGGRGVWGEVRGWAGSAGLLTSKGASLALAAERDSQRLDSRDTSWTLSLGRRF
jgi:hypothetical protein